MKNFKLIFLALVFSPLALAANDAEKNLQQEINALKQQNKVIMERLEATSQFLEQQQKASTATGHAKNSSATTVGGYGELHYNNLKNNKAGGSDKEEIDFHRFVLFFGHQFSDKISFFSELEVEHSISGDGQNGEVELEQAYLDFNIKNSLHAKAGIFLVPVGIINETHEPNTFYGTERNPIESNIVPATWWEAGAGLSGEMAPGWSYDVAITSGLDLSTQNKVRSGRQKASKARANSLMTTGRIKWTAIPGLEVAATIATMDDYTQGQGTKNSATLTEAHIAYSKAKFGLRALYASWDLQGKTNGYKEQTGFYIEPSYKITKAFGLFARYNQWDNQAADAADSEYTQIDVGVNYWPHEDVVIKLDYQNQDVPTGNDEYDGFNIGVGYQF